MPWAWTVTHPESGVTLGAAPLLRDAKTIAEDAYKQHAVFDGDTECYAYTYLRDRAAGCLRLFAHDEETSWYTGVRIEHTATDPATVRTCGQCGRTGTVGFRLFPDADVIHGGKVAVKARSMTECANKAACRKRWPKPNQDEE